MSVCVFKTLSRSASYISKFAYLRSPLISDWTNCHERCSSNVQKLFLESKVFFQMVKLPWRLSPKEGVMVVIYLSTLLLPFSESCMKYICNQRLLNFQRSIISSTMQSDLLLESQALKTTSKYFYLNLLEMVFCIRTCFGSFKQIKELGPDRPLSSQISSSPKKSCRVQGLTC